MGTQLRRVIARRLDLTGSLLLNLAHGWSFAARAGVQFTCFWPDRHALAGSFPLNEIFVWPADAPPFELLKEIKDFPQDAFDLRKVAGKLGDRPFNLGLVPPGVKDIWYLLITPLSLNGEAAEANIAHARNLIRSLTVHPKITAALAKVRERLNPAEYVSVHMRRGDVVANFFKANPNPNLHVGTLAGRYVDIGTYVRVLDQLFPEGSSVLALSDEAESVEELRERLCGRTVIGFHDLGVDRLSRLRRDFFEMLLMSETRSILSAKSAFPGFASLYGDTPRIDVRPWIDFDDLERELRRRFSELSDIDALIPKMMAAYTEWRRVYSTGKRPRFT